MRGKASAGRVKTEFVGEDEKIHRDSVVHVHANQVIILFNADIVRLDRKKINPGLSQQVLPKLWSDSGALHFRFDEIVKFTGVVNDRKVSREHQKRERYCDNL
jgi:hypothetical protein